MLERSKETSEFENKEQTARKELENFKQRSKPLERDQRISNAVRENENKERTDRTLKFQKANRPKEIREFATKEQTIRKRIREFHKKQRTAPKRLESD